MRRSTEHERRISRRRLISYCSKDKAWVRGELLKRIEQAGLKAFIDYRDFTRGAPSIKEMERGVMKCRKTLPDSHAGLPRERMVRDREHHGRRRSVRRNRDLRLIPLLKDRLRTSLCASAALTHIDFTDGADLDLAWRQLLTALGAAPELPNRRRSRTSRRLASSPIRTRCRRTSPGASPSAACSPAG